MTKTLFPVVLTALALTATACTPSLRWGDRAFYSPAHRGYVIASEAPDDRPEIGTQTIVLADPLGGEKLVCKEDVEPFLGAHARANSDDVKRENIAVGAAIGLLPITAIGSLGLYVAGASFSYSIGVAYLAVPDADGSYHEGVDLFRKARWGAARQKFELALAGDAAIGRRTKALFQLGRAYEKLGEHDLAARSYLNFVRRSWIPAEAEYMRAEAYLEDSGIDLPTCKSRDEIEVIWP